VLCSTLLVLVLFSTTPALAAVAARWLDKGQLDFDYGSQVQVAGGAATGEHAESKLFYTPDNRWWGVFGNSTGHLSEGPGVYLYELVSHQWHARIKLPSSDPWMKADTMFDDSSGDLFVSLRDNRSVSGNPRQSNLYHYDYGIDANWSYVSGPTPITPVNKNAEVLTIARDSLGRLWATWEDAGFIKVANTGPGGTTFTSVPAKLPTTKVNTDDVSAITAFDGPDGPRIGIMWSDQVAKNFGFAWRDDDDAIGPDTWHVETAYGDGVGGCGTSGPSSIEACGDDHIHLAVMGDQLFAAVKTSLNDVSDKDPNDPLIVLLHRASDGTWSSHTVSPVSDNASKPIVVLNPTIDTLHVFANYRGVHVWESSIGAPSFQVANRARWTAGGTGNPTSTKQLVSPSTGLVVETSHRGNTDYHHNEFLPVLGS
jgi:hypothetical protein